MTRKRITVAQLAQEASMDVDEVLINLWDAGYNEITRPSDKLKNVNFARHTLGIATRRDLKNISYWMYIFNLDEAGLYALLQKLAVPLDNKSQKMPSKAISRLRSEAFKRGINPHTGKESVITPAKASKEPDFHWRIIGHERPLRYIQPEEVVKFHYALVNDFNSTPDPIDPPGVRSEALLDSAVFRPHTANGGTLKYPTVELAAAALLHAIIMDHPFHNGNKRTALVSLLVFLDENGFFPIFDQDEAFKLVLNIAQHQIVPPDSSNLTDRETLAIAEWLRQHCRVLQRGENTLPFRKLRQILNEYSCNIGTTASNNVVITRAVDMKEVPFLKRHIFKKKLLVTTQITYRGEGVDVPSNLIKKVRKDLFLDDEHGIDSSIFYDNEPMQVSDFITRYRKTLQRLAKW